MNFCIFLLLFLSTGKVNYVQHFSIAWALIRLKQSKLASAFGGLFNGNFKQYKSLLLSPFGKETPLLSRMCLLPGMGCRNSAKHWVNLYWVILVPFYTISRV